MRLFVGLDIPDAIRHSISGYVDELRRAAPDAKWVKPETYHVTLKFIGEWRRDVREVIDALSRIASPPVNIGINGCGFFPNAKAPRVFWVGIHGDEHLVPLAKQVDDACSALGIEAEKQAYHPHLTLARTGSGSPRPKHNEVAKPGMRHLGDRIAGLPAPDFGTIHATEFILYESKLGPGGAQYAKLKAFPLVAR